MSEVKYLDFIQKYVVVFIVICFALFFYWFIKSNLTNVQASSHTITITNPSGPTYVAEALDYATEVHADPWDMSEETDIAGSGTHSSGISGLQVNSGVLSGTTTNTDPAVFIIHPATFESIPMGKDGLVNPINTTDYSHFSLRINNSVPTWIQLYWFYNQQWTDFGVENLWLGSTGWNTYDIDLSANPDWTGNPIGLRFDPATASGVDFSVDWMKLRKAGTASNKLNVQWTDSSPGSWVNLYLDYDGTPANGNEVYMGGKTGLATDSILINTEQLLAGTYYVYITKGVETTPSASFTINQPPLAVVLEPDEEGGADYATTVTGDPWDMSQLSDISSALNIAGLNTNGSVISGVTTSNDPKIYLRVPTPIDTDTYHRATFRFAYDGIFDLWDGTMTRFLWNNFGMNTSTFQTSQDIVTNPLWQTYTVDLEGIELDGGTIGWDGAVNVFRFDPLETTTNRSFYLDFIKLAADDASNGSFDIKWQDGKSSPLPTTVDIYYDTDNSGFDGTLIESGVNQVAGVNTYSWDTNAVPNGLHYIYIEADDGTSTNRAYSTGPVRVNNVRDYDIISAVNPPSSMAANETAFVQVHLINTGGSTWYNETSANPMRLAVLNADGQNFWPNNDTWVGNDRIAMTSPSVPPGGIGSFNFTIKAPATPGNHTIRFMPVVEGVQALKDIGMQFSTNINYDYDILSAVNPPSTMTAGSTAFVQVHLINTGGSTWYNETSANPMRLAVINADGQNFWPNNDTWVGNARMAMTSPSVPPGGIGSFNFTVKAPATLGSHTLQFMPVVEGVQALRNIGMQFVVVSQ